MTPTEAAEATAIGFRHFHDQLAALKDRLQAMATRSEQLIELAVVGLLTRNQDKAEQVIVGDHELNQMEIEVEQLAIELLALQQPLARDLRFIIGAIKVSSDLERIGDHAVNIAQSSLRLITQHTVLIPDPEIEEMARRSRKMLSEALRSFVTEDGTLGRDVCQQDDAVDALHNSVFRILLTHMLADARTINTSLELLLVSRNLERVADLATNIAEDAVYLAEGKQIKHHFDGKH